MENIIKEVYGNRANWTELISNTEGASVFNIKSNGSALIPLIKASVDKRRSAALIAGDVKEVTKLDKYYQEFTASEYRIEEPIEKDGKFFSCYMNRSKGFIYPDAPLEVSPMSIRDIITLAKIPMFVPKTFKEADEFFNQQPQPFGLVDLNELGHDVIALVAERHLMSGLYNHITDMGFPSVEGIDWGMVGWQGQESFWTYAAAAIKIKSKALIGAEFILPVISGYELGYLAIPREPYKSYNLKMVPDNKDIHRFAVPRGGRNPLLAVPITSPVTITIDDVPITKEEYDQIRFSLNRYGNYSGRATGTWLGEGRVQLAIELMETERHYRTVKGRYERIITIQASIMLNGYERSAFVPGIEVIPDLETTTHRIRNGAPITNPDNAELVDIPVDRDAWDPQDGRWSWTGFDGVLQLAAYDIATLQNFQVEHRQGPARIIGVPNQECTIRLLYNSNFDDLLEGIEKHTFTIQPITV